jgi:hypothetical protein
MKVQANAPRNAASKSFMRLNAVDPFNAVAAYTDAIRFRYQDGRLPEAPGCRILEKPHADGKALESAFADGVTKVLR